MTGRLNIDPQRNLSFPFRLRLQKLSHCCCNKTKLCSKLLNTAQCIAYYLLLEESIVTSFLIFNFYYCVGSSCC